MEETYQITSALKYLPFGKHVALLTDARFSGVSTGACIGHMSPEALSGGPLARIQDGDQVQVIIDRNTLSGTVNLLGPDGTVEAGSALLAARAPRPDLHADADLPPETRLWAALTDVSGGAWGGAVYDVDKILEVIAAGRKAMGLA
jgi:dihydroxyacid dehydratase/phosphogluconate dehydratase